MVLLALLNWCSYPCTLVWTMGRENAFVEAQQLCSAQRHIGNHSNSRTFLTLHSVSTTLLQFAKDGETGSQSHRNWALFSSLPCFVPVFLRQHLVHWGHGLSRGFVGSSLYNITTVKATNKAFCFFPSPFPVSSAMGIAALFWMFVQHLLHLGMVSGKIKAEQIF